MKLYSCADLWGDA